MRFRYTIFLCSKSSFTLECSGIEQSFIFISIYSMRSNAYQRFEKRCYAAAFGNCYSFVVIFAALSSATLK